ncbi:MAG: hypothetical protein E4H36_12710 [Spirochaetales bacterium]|nr:MAG: hypothetical protein E4H36_12710 [Spirochaetales bacterium]
MKRIAAAAWFLLLAAAVYSQSSVSAVFAVDWEKREINLDTTLTILGAQQLSPRVRSTSEQTISERLPYLIREKTASLPLDSFATVGAYSTTNPVLLSKLDQFAKQGKLQKSYLSTDLKVFHAEYSYSLDGLSALFVNHQAPLPLPKLLVFEPTAPFSGIVIYMKDLFPVKGELETEGPDKGQPKMAKLKPCLFPKIFDESMNLLLERTMMKPEYVRQWGVAGYASGIVPAVERIGFTPLRVLGRAIYGKEHTDIVITGEAARKILASENNRRLLTEGRILIICDLE